MWQFPIVKRFSLFSAEWEFCSGNCTKGNGLAIHCWDTVAMGKVLHARGLRVFFTAADVQFRRITFGGSLVRFVECAANDDLPRTGSPARRAPCEARSPRQSCAVRKQAYWHRCANVTIWPSAQSNTRRSECPELCWPRLLHRFPNHRGRCPAHTRRVPPLQPLAGQKQDSPQALHSWCRSREPHAPTPPGTS
jgi:hypothetical protein